MLPNPNRARESDLLERGKNSGSRPLDFQDPSRVCSTLGAVAKKAAFRLSAILGTNTVEERSRHTLTQPDVESLPQKRDPSTEITTSQAGGPGPGALTGSREVSA